MMHLDRQELRIGLSRATLPLSFEVRSPRGGGTSSSYRVGNISRNGLFVETDGSQQFENGEALHFAIRSGGERDSDLMHGVARVRWVRGQNLGPYRPQGMGVQVVELHEQADRRYIELMEKVLGSMTVGELMDAEPCQATGGEAVATVLARMRDKRSSYAVIVSQDGAPQGLLTGENLVSAALVPDFLQDSAGTHMTPDNPTISAELGFEEACRIMHLSGAFALMVTEEDQLVGVITSRHILRHWSELMHLRTERLQASSERAMNVLAHDLRTPIGLVHTTNQMLAQGQVSPEEYVRDGFADLVATSCDTMLNLIDETLDIGKVKRSNVRLNRAVTDIEELARHVVRSFQPTALIKRIELEFKTHGPLPRIKADAFRIEQVLSNLLSNAIKFTQDGGHVIIGTRSLHSKIAFWVSDNGPGLPPEQTDLLLLSDEEAEAKSHRGHGGLGLAIAKKLVEAHGGTLVLDTKLGLGTTVTVTLPISELQ